MPGFTRICFCILLLVQSDPSKVYSSISYYFNNYPISQKQFSNSLSSTIYSLEGTIVTDGTKGFISTANLISVNITVKLGSSNIKTLYFGSDANDPNAEYLIWDYISANNLFATDSHLGIVETWRNSYGGPNTLGIDLTNKNLTILDPVDNTRFLVIKNQFSSYGRILFEYGSEQSLPFAGTSWRFYNYYEPTNAPEPDFGSPFSYFNQNDQHHMNNEMVADGYGEYAWSRNSLDPQNMVTSGTWVIASNVPEPSSLSLLLAGVAVLMAGRRRDKFSRLYG